MVAEENERGARRRPPLRAGGLPGAVKGARSSPAAARSLARRRRRLGRPPLGCCPLPVPHQDPELRSNDSRAASGGMPAQPAGGVEQGAVGGRGETRGHCCRRHLRQPDCCALTCAPACRTPSLHCRLLRPRQRAGDGHDGGRPALPGKQAGAAHDGLLKLGQWWETARAIACRPATGACLAACVLPPSASIDAPLCSAGRLPHQEDCGEARGQRAAARQGQMECISGRPAAASRLTWIAHSFAGCSAAAGPREEQVRGARPPWRERGGSRPGG